MAVEVQRIADAFAVAPNPIVVTRSSEGSGGFLWAVTFNGVHTGDLGSMAVEFANVEGNNPRMGVTETVKGAGDIFPTDYTFEVQAIRIRADTEIDVLGGDAAVFALEFEGATTADLLVSASADAVRDALELLPSVTTVAVEQFEHDPECVTVPAAACGVTWWVTFTHLEHERVQGAGNIGLLRPVYDATAFGATNPTVEVSTILVGSHPTDLYPITGLTAGDPVYARVSAYSAAGFSSPSAVVVGTPLAHPDAPANVFITVSSATQLDLAWDAPPSNGGDPIGAYDVQWFTSAPTAEEQVVTTSSDDGIAEVQRVVTKATANNLVGGFFLCFLGECTEDLDVAATDAQVSASLRRLSTIGNVNVTRTKSRIRIPFTASYDAGVQGVVSTRGRFNFVATGAVTDVQEELLVGDPNRAFWVSNSPEMLAADSSASGTNFVFAALPSEPTTTLDLGTIFPGDLPDAADGGTPVFAWAFGYEWTVTFFGSFHVGAQPLLEAHPSRLGFTGSNPDLLVDRLVTGERPISGSFQLGFNGHRTPRLSWDASAGEVEAALEALDDLGDMGVTRASNANGFNWIVTFLTDVTPVALLTADGNGLTGPSVRISVARQVVGVAPGGLFSETITANPTAPSFTTSLTSAATGTPYGARVRASNIKGFGPHGASSPALQVPRAVPEPPTIFVTTLSGVALKVNWQSPTSNGDTIDMFKIQWDTTATFDNVAAGGFEAIFTDVVRDSAGRRLTDVVADYFYNIGGLVDGVTYYVRVAAHNDRGFSEFSDTVTGVPAFLPPGPPLDVVVTVLSGVQLEVTWAAPSVELLEFGGDGGKPVTEYRVEWAEDDFALVGVPVPTFLTVDGDARSVVIGRRDTVTGQEDETLRLGFTYAVRVKARNSVDFGEPGYPAPAKVTTANVVPSTPLGLVVAPHDGSTLAASWTPPAYDGGCHLEDIRLYVDTEPDMVGAAVTTLPLVDERQVVSIQSDVTNEVQYMDMTVMVDNEVQTLRTLVLEDVDEVQSFTTSGPAVVRHVQTVTTSATNLDEVQTVTTTGPNLDEEQLLQTDGTRTPEIIEVTTTGSVQREVQRIHIVEVDGGRQAVLGVEITAQTAAPLELFNIIVNCPSQPTATFELDAGTLGVDDVGTGTYFVDLTAAAITIDDIRTAIKDKITAISGAYVSIADVGSTSSSFRSFEVTCNDDGLVADLPVGYENPSLALVQRLDAGQDDAVLGSGQYFRVGINLFECTLCTVGTTGVEFSVDVDVGLVLGDVDVLRDAINEIGSIGGNNAGMDYKVEVTVDPAVASADGVAWFVTFTGDTVNGDIPEMVIDPAAVLLGPASENTIQPVEETLQGSELKGNFFLTFDDTLSRPSGNAQRTSLGIPVDAADLSTDTSMERSLEDITDVYDVDVTRTGPDAQNGYTWTITFLGNDGDLADWTCVDDGLGGFSGLSGSPTVGCGVVETQTGGYLMGTLSLTVQVPQLGQSNPRTSTGGTVVGPFPWDATTSQVTDAFEAVLGANSVTVTDHGQYPLPVSQGGPGNNGGRRWGIKFLTFPGDVPPLTTDTTGLSGITAPTAVVGTGNAPLPDSFLGVSTISLISQQEGNQVDGQYRLQFEGEVSPALDPDMSDTDFKDALETMANIEVGSLSVTRDLVPNSAFGYTYTVEFIGQDVGGNVAPMTFAQTCEAGTVTTGGTEPCNALTGAVSATVTFAEPTQGNEIQGDFRLRLQYPGDTTYETANINFDADNAAVITALQSLPNIDVVDVIRADVPVQTDEVSAYEWTITFISDTVGDDSALDFASSGYSQAWGQNVGWVPDFSCVTDGILSGSNDPSNLVDCTVATTVFGIGPVNGDFQVQFDTRACSTCAIKSLEISDPIRHSAKPTRAEAGGGNSAVEAILERMVNVGDVEVSRSAIDPTNGAYTWFVTFITDVGGIDNVGNHPQLTLVPNLNGGVVNDATGVDDVADVLMSDAEVVRGNVLRGDFVLNYQGVNTAPLNWNATDGEVDDALTALAGTTLLNVDVTGRQISKYGSWEWDITFTENAGVVPTGASNVDAIVMDQSLAFDTAFPGCSVPGPTWAADGEGCETTCPAGATCLAAATKDYSNTETVEGSAELGGSFTLDFSSAIGPRELDFDASDERIELTLEELATLGDVHVSRSQFTVGNDTEGWDALAAPGVRAGWRFSVTFVANTGSFNDDVKTGFSHPPGSGNQPVLQRTFDTLTGALASLDMSEATAGATRQSGTFTLTHLGEATPALGYDATGASVTNALTGLDTIGAATATQQFSVNAMLPGTVSVATGATVAVTSTDLRNVLSPGDVIRIGPDAAPGTTLTGSSGDTSLGRAGVTSGSDTVTMTDHFRHLLYVGQTVRLLGEEYTVLTTGASVTTVTITPTGTLTSGTWRVNYVLDGAETPTACVPFDATEQELEDAINAAIGAVDSSEGVSVAKTGDLSTAVDYTVSFVGSLVDTATPQGLSITDGFFTGFCTAESGPDGTPTDGVVDTIPAVNVGAFTLTAAFPGRTNAQVDAYAVPQLFRVRTQHREVIEVDIGSSSAAQTGEFRILVGGLISNCIPYDATPDQVEAAFLSGTTASTVTATKRNKGSGFGFIYTVYFQDTQDAGMLLGDVPAACSTCTDATPAGLVGSSTSECTNVGYSEPALFSAVQLDTSRVHDEFTSAQLPLGTYDDPDVEAMWLGPSASPIEVYKVDGLQWLVRFDTNLGDQEPLVADFTGVAGTGVANASAVVDDFVEGVLPSAALLDGLVQGIEYHVQISATNCEGESPLGPTPPVASIPMETPGAPRDVSAAVALQVFEVQDVTLGATHVDEVQVITTTATPVSEVQTIRTSAPQNSVISGGFELVAGSLSTATGKQAVTLTTEDGVTALSAGAFTLEYNAQQTACIAWNADAATVKAELEANALVTTVRVWVTTDTATTRTWSIFFDTVVGGVMDTLTAHHSDTAVPNGGGSCTALSSNTTIAAEVTDPEGTPIAFDAEPAEVAAQLALLPGLGNSHLSRTLVSDEGGYAWSATFEDVTVDVDDLACDDTSLLPAEATCTVDVDIDRNLVGGTFRLMFNGDTTGDLPVAATEAELAAELAALVTDVSIPVEDSVRVSRSGPDGQAGYVWSVTFRGQPGDVALMETLPSLTGTDAAVVVAPFTDGNVLGGDWTLTFGSRTTAALPVGATAAEVQAALNAVGMTSITSPVSVASREDGPDEQLGDTYTVTFAQEGDLQLLDVDTTGLTGVGASGVVCEVVKGSPARGDRLAVSFDIPLSNGGFAVTSYLVEWDVNMDFNSLDAGSTTVTDECILARRQVVSLLSDADGALDLGDPTSTWTLAYGTERTEELSADVSADDLRDAIEGFTGVHAVLVERSVSRIRLAGNASVVGTRPDHVVTTEDVRAEVERGDLIWVGDEQFMVSLDALRAFDATTVPLSAVDAAHPIGLQEVHTIRIEASSTPTQGGYTLTLGANGPTACLDVTDDETAVKAAIEAAMPFPVDVAPATASTRSIGGSLYTITFTTTNPTPGDVMTPSAVGTCGSTPLPADITATGEVSVTGVAADTPSTHPGADLTGLKLFRAGGGPAYTVDFVGADAPLGALFPPSHSLSPASATIRVDGGACESCVYVEPLLAGTTYYVRVTAENSVGPGAASTTVTGGSPASGTPAQIPGAPGNVTLAVVSGTELEVFFNEPADTGGDEIVAYRVEWDFTDSFDSEAGSPAGSAVLSGTFLDAAQPFAYAINTRTLSPFVLVAGDTLWVRVSAENSVPFTDTNRVWAYSTPSNATTADLPPSPPQSVALESLGPESLRVVVDPPLREGGASVLSYDVSYDTSSTFANAQEVSAVVANGDIPLLEPAGLRLYDLLGLTTGEETFVRVRSVNAVGPSDWMLAVGPASLTPQRWPDAVTDLSLTSPASSASPITTMDVAWGVPATNGGDDLDNYLVEVWEAAPRPEVQTITLANSLGSADTTGEFLISFRGESTSGIQHDISAVDLRYELLQLTDGAHLIDHLEVSRADSGGGLGYTWSVTFSIVPDSAPLGDVAPLLVDTHTLASVSSCTDNDCIQLFGGDGAGSRLDGHAEVQEVSVVDTVDGSVGGFFRLTFESGTTPYMAADISADDMATILNDLVTTNQVSVTRSTVTGGFTWWVTFDVAVGNPLGMTMDAALLTGSSVTAVAYDGAHDVDTSSPPQLLCPMCKVGERPPGYAQHVVASTKFSLQITDRVPGVAYTVRVSAVNAKGAGVPSTAGPLTIPQQTPGAPNNVVLAVDTTSSSQLVVSYDAPDSDGGDDILMYRVERSTSSQFLGGVVSTDVRCSADTLPDVFEVSLTFPGGDTVTAVTGGFALDIVKDGYTFRTQLIAGDAVATAHEETPTSGVYCDFTSSYCSPPVSQPFGSLEAHLEDPDLTDLVDTSILNLVSDGVTVTRGATATDNSVTWTVTFLDDPTNGGWDLLEVAGSTVATNVVGTVAVTQLVVGEASDALDCLAPQALTALNQGVPYYARVTAYNSFGFGAQSTVANDGGAVVPQQVPGRPTVVSLVVTGGCTLRLCFSPPTSDGGAAIDHYRVDTALTSAFDANTTREELFTSLSGGGPFCFSIQHLTTGTEYFVQVAAHNPQGYGEPQAPTPPSETPRKAPGGPATTTVSVTSSTKLTVGWTAPLDDGGANVTQYSVEWDIDSEFESPSILPHKGTVVVSAEEATSYTISDLTPGLQYYVRVSASNSVGFGISTLSTPTSQAPSRQLPGQPSTVHLTNAAVLSGEILATFSPPFVPAHGTPCGGGGTLAPFDEPAACPSGMGVDTQADGGSPITSFEVQFCTSPAFTSCPAAVYRVVLDSEHTAGQTVFTRTISGLNTAETYYVRVAAITAEGIGAYCDREGLLCDGDVLMLEPRA